ncbi:hypothetical protein ACFWBF_14490 [Streptomyces sp. NPDC060028]|uniref:hypothetical protein n=1 Tax=Streptomyces sp. NPDC060028 TaxID=3347041 RepID=UPI0036C7764A
MSRRTDNRHRVATLCREATGLAHHTCLKWAAAGLITRRQPVPDAAGAEQRAFESQLVLELADRLRHEQVDGAVLGFTHARPSRSGLVLGLHPATADAVLAAVVPRFDERYGGLRGVPGLRLSPQGGEWALTRVGGEALVRLVHPRADWVPRLPDHGDGLTQLWRSHRRGVHPAEAAEVRRWGSEGGGAETCGRLLSRVLRRPLLVNAAGTAHGWANTYHHGRRSLVIEWCCAVGAPEMEDRLRRSGLAAPSPGTASEADGRADPPGRISLDGASLTVRRGPCAERVPC